MRKPLIFTFAATLLATASLQAAPAVALTGNLSSLKNAVPARSDLVQPVRDGRRAAFAIGLGAGLLGGAILSQRHHDRYDYYGRRAYHPRGYEYYPDERYYDYGPRPYYQDDYPRAGDSGNYHLDPNVR